MNDHWWMFDRLLNIDESILLTINGLHTSVLDSVMWYISGKLTWIPFYVSLLICLICNISIKRLLIYIVALVLCIYFADQICASVIRPIVGRLRPSNIDNYISPMIHLVNGYRGGSYSFPSCHAANTFALAAYMSCILKRSYQTWLFFIWAALVSCSRIYLGVHYPSDILIGAMFGLFSGGLFYWLGTMSGKAIYPSPGMPVTIARPDVTRMGNMLPAVAFGGTLVVFLILALF